MEVARSQWARPLTVVAILINACGGEPGIGHGAGAVIALERFDATSVTNLRVTHDANWNIVLAGAFDGPFDLGRGSIGGVRSSSLVLASFDANLELRWARVFDGSFSEGTHIGLATTAGGDVIVSLDRYGASIDLGGGVLPANTPTNLEVGAIARFAGGDGAHVWSRNTYSLTGDEAIVPMDAAVDGLGRIVVTGRRLTRGSADRPLQTGVIVALSPDDGAPIWSVAPWQELLLRGSRVVASPESLVVTAVGINTEGTGVITEIDPADGREMWRAAVPRLAFGEIGVALDTTQSVLIFYDASTIDGALGQGIFAVDKLSGVNGAHLWSWILGTGEYTDGVGAVSVATDSQNNVGISGRFHGSVLIGERVLLADVVRSSLFVLELDADGGTLWSRYTESVGFSVVGDLQIDGDDRLLASGYAFGNDVASTDPSIYAFGNDFASTVPSLYMLRFAP